MDATLAKVWKEYSKKKVDLLTKPFKKIDKFTITNFNNEYEINEYYRNVEPNFDIGKNCDYFDGRIKLFCFDDYINKITYSKILCREDYIKILNCLRENLTNNIGLCRYLINNAPAIFDEELISKLKYAINKNYTKEFNRLTRSYVKKMNEELVLDNARSVYNKIKKFEKMNKK